MSEAERIIFEDLFTEEAMTPAQFFGRTGAERVRRTGECQLLAALLADAIRCYQRNYFAHTRGRRRLFREAEQWLMEPPPADGSGPVFSFSYVCDVLGLDPEMIRSRLRQWQEAQSPGPGVEVKRPVAPKRPPRRTRWRA